MIVGNWFAAGRLFATVSTVTTTNFMTITVLSSPTVPELSDVPSALLVLSGVAGLFGYRHWRKSQSENGDSNQA